MRRSVAAILSIILSLWATSESSLAGIQSPLPALPHRGPTVKGMQLALGAWSNTFSIGHPIPIALTVSNVSGKDLNMYTGDLAHALAFVVKDQSGRVIRSRNIPLSGYVIGGGVYLGVSTPRVIEVHLDDWVPITQPGMYSVSASLRVHLDDRSGPALRSNLITIQVVQ